MLRPVKLSNFIHEDYIADLNICDELIEWFHANKKMHRTGAFKKGIDDKQKMSRDFSFNFDEESNKEKVVASYGVELQTILERFLQINSFANQVEPFGIKETVNIQYYKPYGGYRALHCERAGVKTTMARHLVFQTYLNTVEDGGETEFFYQQYKCKAVKGKTLIWPVDWTHSHRGIVSPTEEKYIITGWYSFEASEVE